MRPYPSFTPTNALTLTSEAAAILTDYTAFVHDTWGAEAPTTPDAVLSDALRLLRTRYRQFHRWQENEQRHDTGARPSLRVVPGSRRVKYTHDTARTGTLRPRVLPGRRAL